MLVTRNREKLADAIRYFTQRTRNCGRVKLFKLLFFLDFQHFKETGHSVTGLDYFAFDMGPVPVELYTEISEKEEVEGIVSAERVDLDDDRFMTQFRARSPFSGEHMTPREMRIMDELVEIYRDATSDMMSHASHEFNRAWYTTRKQEGQNVRIDYMLATTERGQDDRALSLDQLLEEIEIERRERETWG